ncbi:metalloregulator ArsR/SmtB family transcription factor [Actinotalea sp. Marseille-Q4924]|uniref:helix-turn-helix transcriptional regulator n=1 Tax=Actinotalea sp. Marseille-Q4924 TaxID=2866571 RepID=UPI001CE4B51C|nr:helix-turn-helix domain-containing protein [Actinotalea sp. Marseille-Q4924]
MGDLSGRLEGVGVLAEPARRALYEYVLRQQEPVSREQAAQALGTPVHSAKFHLDRLAAAGLLEVEYRRLSGRTGPGAGRPAKLYRRSDREVSLSVPPRRYDLASDVMAEAIERATRGGVPVAETLPAVARETGRELADDDAAGAVGRGSGLERARAVLERNGYEPRVVGGDLRLVNCPFDRLAADHTGLVCGMNVSLVEGVLEGVGATDLQARLAPEAGYCCVTVRG